MSIELLANEEEALAAAWRLQRTGNFVAAFDASQAGLTRWPGSLPLRHVGILALASCGSTRAALGAYRTSGLADSDVEDFLALEARLLKDMAFQAGANHQSALLIQAAEAYERIVARTRGSYPAQNAAFLWALSGNESRALRLATTVARDLATVKVPADPEAAYFYWATVAEAALVLHDKSGLSAAVDAANTVCRRNLWARTRTIAQMRRLLPLRSDCREIVLRWHVPAVGFVFPSSEPFSLAQDMELIDAADAAVLVYEASSGRVARQGLADFGSELHVIMPNAPVDDQSPGPINLVLNRQTSGQRAGYTWSSLLLDESRDNEHWCAEVALGLSLGLAEALHAPWWVLREVEGRWCQYQPRDSAGFCREFSRRVAADRHTTRYALFFADAVGYSTLNAPQIRQYWSKLLPETGAQVLRRHADAMIFSKTWGDAVHGVFTSAAAAARAALEMTAATAGLAEDLAEGRRLEFRMALHYGAADQGLDPIEDSPSYFGPQLSLAARIVPVVPPGGVFVTEAFAAQLSLEGAQDLACTYVGSTELAKGYGHVRLLSLAWR